MQQPGSVGVVDTASPADQGGEEHLRLEFIQFARRLRALGDVVVLVNATAVSVPPGLNHKALVKMVGHDPERDCLFRVDPCSGATTKLPENERFKSAEELVVSPCVPPQDGADRGTALQDDIMRLGVVATNVRVSALREGKEALLCDVLTKGTKATCGVVVSPDYPRIGADWFLLDSAHDIEGFTSSREGPLHEQDLELVNLSLHPRDGRVLSAADHILAVLTQRKIKSK